MIQKQDLVGAYFDNVRHNQIGVGDGITPEVAADLGFETPERVAQIMSELGQKAVENAVTHGLQVDTNVEASITPSVRQVPEFIKEQTAELHSNTQKSTTPRPLSQREQINESQMERLRGEVK